MTSTLRALDHTGDTRLEWDPDNADEVNAARAMFDKLKGKRYLAYKTRGDGSRGELLREFDPAAEQIVMAPQLVGG